MSHRFTSGPPSSASKVKTGIALVAVTVAATLGTFAQSATAASAPSKVTAVLTEYHIALSKKSFAPGAYVFVAKNKGAAEHALAITGPGLSNKKTPLLAPGTSANLAVTLHKGSYDIFCPVPGHKGLGMNVAITVRVGGATTAGSKSSSGAKKGSSSGGYGY